MTEQAETASAVAEVVFPVPVDHGFDYLVPPALAQSLRPGHRVAAPFGSRGLQTGVVTAVKRRSPEDKSPFLKTLHSVLDDRPALDERDLGLARWLADTYMSSIGEAVFCVLPIGKNAGPKRETSPAPAEPTPPSAAPVLTPDQEAACARIVPAARAGGFHAFLLFGVAAAGKTEVYLRAAAAALAEGRSVLYLVPEIGLTPQTEHVLRGRFGDLVDVWHSEMSRGERWRVWDRALRGRGRLVLGPRSALFLPLQNLGLIVVDEEHDPSYKEETRPAYHARDAALEKARLAGAAAVLGSATPSLETYKRALDGGLELVEMGRRVEDRPFPSIHIVDTARAGGRLLSEPLAQAVIDALARKEQSLLFLNRRGFFTYVTCPSCGWEARCPSCGVSLVYHKSDRDELRCHYCFHRAAPPEKCPDCGSPAVKLKGRGTQRVEEELKTWFPGARALRWDRDTTRRRGAHGRAFESVRAEDVDIVVGTQMITQGLDFPRVTVVGVLDADQPLRFPDFRAAERAFQLLAQVSGRAGRGERPGSVYVQTRHAGHYALQAAAAFDYRAFAEEELRFRREMSYPPFVRLAQILLSGKDAAAVEKAAVQLMEYLERPPLENAETLGPAPAFRPPKAGNVQWQVMVKFPPGNAAGVFARLKAYRPPRSVAAAVRVDPEDL
ncbi:MAG: replication restart helicase PriA [Elusimicrobiota bacterium]